MRYSWSVSPVREPPRLKTSRQQTVVATAIRPPMFIISNARIPVEVLRRSSLCFFFKETVFIGQIADRIIAAGSIVFPILIQVSEVAGKRRNRQDISEKGEC